MIILFSIMLLLILVYIGMNLKEGMTLSNASALIPIINDYYAKQTTNANSNTSNTNNESNTLVSISKLQLTDASYVAILQNSDLDAPSKINSIRTLFTKSITEGKEDAITIDQFNSMIPIVNNTHSTGNQAAQYVNELENIASKDKRFTDMFKGDPKTILENIQSKMINMISK